MEAHERICFLGGFDFTKEAYFLNNLKNKKILLGDVSIRYLLKLKEIYPSIDICKVTLESFVANPNDLIIVNCAEYFLTNQQMVSFLSQGSYVILNNAHIHMTSSRWRLFNIYSAVKSLIVNLLSFINDDIRQLQFRGWMRTFDEYVKLGQNSGKQTEAFIVNNERTRFTKYGPIFQVMIGFCKR